jgi:hypothetical protein
VARIRTVKPEFWTDDALTECSRDARLLFIGTWNVADDKGGLDRSAKQLKGQVFPHDELDVESLIQELQRSGSLIEYEVDGKKYLHIKNFEKHQVINRPSPPRVPLYDPSLRTHRILPETSVSHHAPLTAGLEGKGREGNGREKNPTAASPPAGFEEFQKVYPKRSGDPGWKKAQRAWNARLTENHSPQDFIRGAERYAAYCLGTGKVGSEYVQQASTFLGPGKAFLLPWTLPLKAENASERILRKLREPEAIEHEPDEIPRFPRQ